jgi:peroxiredoxin
MAFEIGVPVVDFKMRMEIDEAPGFEWQTKSSLDIFKGKKIVLIGLPGAFTPTCSSTHLPGFDANYDTILEHGFDDVYCLSVNDSFVMNAWFKNLAIEKVKPLPDGSGKFTRTLGMLVDKDNLGFGMRSWRYSAIVDDGIIKHMYVEPGLCDNAPTDPFECSDVYTMLEYLKRHFPKS